MGFFGDFFWVGRLEDVPLIQKQSWATFLTKIGWLVVSNIFLFSPLLGGMIQFD